MNYALSETVKEKRDAHRLSHLFQDLASLGDRTDFQKKVPFRSTKHTRQFHEQPETAQAQNRRETLVPSATTS